MKRNLTVKAVAAVLLLSFSCLLVPAASAVAPPAQAPVWQKGDAWAMGNDFDWGPELVGTLRNLTDGMGTPSEMNIERFDLGANGSSWLVFEVTDANSTEYVLNGKVAIRLNLEVHLKVTGPMPDPGVYDFSEDMPTHDRTVQVDAAFDLALIVDTNTVLETGTLAIKSMGVGITGSAIASLDMKNYLDVQHDSLNSTRTVSYVDYQIDLRFEVGLTFNLTFEPWLDVFEFPLNVGDSWNMDSVVTMSGAVTGSLDINGLPVSIEQELFSNPTLQQLGMTSFPIDFSKISLDGPPNIVNGVLQPITNTISIPMRCTSTTGATLPFFGEIIVYEIEVNDGATYLHYSDEIRFLSPTGLNMSGLGGLPSELTGIDADMQPCTAATAKQNIAEIESYEATLLSGSSSTGSTLDPMVAILIGVVLVLVGVVVVVALVIRRRK